MAFDDLMFITRYFFRENYKIDKAPTMKKIYIISTCPIERDI